MKTLPAIALVVAVAGTVFAMTREAPPEDDAQVRLPVAAVSAPEITPWLQAAAEALGHKRVRAYDGSVFVEVGDDQISFFKEGNALQMHVGFESKYRHAKHERDDKLKELQSKGHAIFEHAVSLQARSASKERMASAPAAVPAG